VSGAFLDSLMDLLGEDGYRTIAGTIRVETGPVLVAARNKLVQVFMEQMDFPWLFMVDTDMVFGPDVIDRLKQVASPHIIAGALCFGWFSDARIAKPTLYGEGMAQITSGRRALSSRSRPRAPPACWSTEHRRQLDLPRRLGRHVRRRAGAGAG
jgi:hypothetical protein